VGIQLTELVLCIELLPTPLPQTLHGRLAVVTLWLPDLMILFGEPCCEKLVA